MNQQFFHIATINFSHEYTGNSSFDGFSFALTNDSKVLAQNLNIVFKPFQGGLMIFGTDPKLLEEEERNLCIDLFPNNTLLYNFTDFGREFRPDLHVFFFSLATGKEGLYPGDHVSIENSLTVLRREALQDILTKAKLGQIQLLDVDGIEIPVDQVYGFFSDGEAAVFYGLEEGISKGFFKPSSKMVKLPFGRLNLNCSQLYKEYSPSNTPKKYSIHFKTKKTLWKYILSDKAYDKFNELKIIDAQNSDFRFTETEFEIQDNWRVRSFESETALPYQMDGMPKFQLVEQSNGGQVLKVIIKQLPKASPEALFRSTTNDEVLITHIFI